MTNLGATHSPNSARAEDAGPSSSALRATTTEADLCDDAEAMKFRPRDSRIFLGKLALLGVILGGSFAWIMMHGWLASLPAQLLVGIMYAHALELQHQALHGTGVRGRRRSRLVGALLGLPMLVSYSRYRALHLWHHRHLGTPDDSEFFDYDATAKITYRSLLSSLFNVRRWTAAVKDVVMSPYPRTAYEDIITPSIQRLIRTEYRLMLLMLLALGALTWVTGEPLILTLWLIPLVCAEPVHTLIELPEHLLCDRSMRDVFRNTRSIRGSWFSFWLTNGNNFHTEHHLRAGVPINKLDRVHAAIADKLENYSPSYWAFYRTVLQEAARRA